MKFVKAFCAKTGKFGFVIHSVFQHILAGDQSGPHLFRLRDLFPWPPLFLLLLQPRIYVMEPFVADVDRNFISYHFLQRHQYQNQKYRWNRWH